MEGNMTKQKVKATRLDASEFLPDLDSYEGLAVTEEYAYYMGIIEGCPVAQINCGGLTFPMRNDVFRPDPTRPGKTMRVPVPGGQNNHVTVDHINALREGLKRVIIRWKDEPAQIEEPGTGKNIKSPHKRARRGKILRIPTAERIAQAREDGTHVPRYVRDPLDEPAAKYMYFQLCPNQDKPERGHDFSTIAETGIVWPGELDAETEALLA